MHIGIDPGQKGGIAYLSEGRRYLGGLAMPADHDLCDLLSRRKADWGSDLMAWVEWQHSMPKQGVRSMFTFGTHYGTIQGILIALRIPYQLVRPFNWQRSIHAGIDRKGFSNPKERTLRAMRQIYPDQSFVMKGCRKPHEGIVDALAIATYGLSLQSGKQILVDKGIEQDSKDSSE